MTLEYKNIQFYIFIAQFWSGTVYKVDLIYFALRPKFPDLTPCFKKVKKKEHVHTIICMSVTVNIYVHFCIICNIFAYMHRLIAYNCLLRVLFSVRNSDEHRNLVSDNFQPVILLRSLTKTNSKNDII